MTTTLIETPVPEPDPIAALPRPARERVLDAIEDLAEDPRPHGARKR